VAGGEERKGKGENVVGIWWDVRGRRGAQGGGRGEQGGVRERVGRGEVGGGGEGRGEGCGVSGRGRVGG